MKKQVKTYTVAETSDDYILCDENGFLTSLFQPERVFKEFQVKEKEPWYATTVFDAEINIEDIEDFENFNELDNEELQQTLSNMKPSKFMNILRDALGEEGIEEILNDIDSRCGFNRCSDDYVADGQYDLEIYDSGTIYFVFEIKYKFWINQYEEIECEPVWEFKD